jgi:hypothetical protein
MFSKKSFIRFLKVTTLLTVLFVGIMGFMHTPWGYRVLEFFGVGCPYADISPEAIEQARLDSAHRNRKEQRTPARPALGFELDATTPNQIDEWAKKHNITCETARKGTFKKCLFVPAEALEGPQETEIKEVAFQFTPDAKFLVNMTVLHTGLSSPQAADKLKKISTVLKDSLGEPHRITGTASAEYLAGGYLRTATYAYKFHDYMAQVTATNVGKSGVLVRQHYMSIPD